MWDDIQYSLSKLNWKYSISSFPRCTQYFKPIPEPQVAFFWWVTRLLISFSSLVTSTLLLLVTQSVMSNTGHVSRCHVSRVRLIDSRYLTARWAESLWHVKFVNSDLGNQKIKSIFGLELHVWLSYYFPSPRKRYPTSFRVYGRYFHSLQNRLYKSI